MEFIVAYDIAHPRRLQRISRRMERHGLRCQKSVFLVSGSHEQVQGVLAELAPLMNLAEDVVQAWRIAPDGSNPSLVRGAVIPRRPGAVVSTGKQSFTTSEVRE